MEQWLLDNMHSVLITIEVLWVGGFLAVFVAYFFVRRHFRSKSKAAALPQQRSNADQGPQGGRPG